jgi:hypothetical protein
MSSVAVRLVGLVVLLADLALLVVALYLGFQLEPTARAVASSAKGQAIAIPAAIGAVLAVVATVRPRRRLGVMALVAALLLTAVALTVLVTRQLPDATSAWG